MNYVQKAFYLGVSIVGLVACATKAAQTDDAQSSELKFIVIGDAPYSSDDEVMLAKAVPAVKAGDYPFVIHVGDYKGGGQQCLGKFDDRLEQLIDDLAPVPVFYTPGDNEWTDCDRFTDPVTGKKYSDLERLKIVRDRFGTGTPAGAGAFDYRRQADLAENATWRHQGVRFLTLHVTGTNNGRDWVTVDAVEDAAAEADKRDAANLQWLSAGFEIADKEDASAVVIAFQADVTDIKDKPVDKMCKGASKKKHDCDGFTDLRKAMQAEAISFGRPVLVIHGDTAPFTLNQDFDGENAPNLWRLNAAGDAGRNKMGIPYGVRDIAEVTVHSAGDAPFSARGVLSGVTPTN